jgi:hypothetical protein
VESLATLQRGPIFDGRGGIFFTAQEGVAPPDGAVFTALRPERLPLEDAEVEAEIEWLKALPLAEYEVEREPAASRLGMRLSVLDRLRSDGAKEVGTAIPQRTAAITALPTGKSLRQIARRRCLESLIGLLRGHDLPPQGTVPAQCDAAIREFVGLSERAFYNCLREAERVTGNHKWGKAGRRPE